VLELEEIKKVKRQHSFSLLCKAGVIGVGIGQKEVQGKPINSMSITILVEEKLRESSLSHNKKLPREFEGIPTDVIPFGSNEGLVKVRLRQSPMPEDDRTKRWRPAPGGVSVGHYLLQGAGTLGGWVFDKSGEPLLLSCWHVIANSGNCKKGDPVLQPAVLDGGKCPDDIIAFLDDWVDVEMIVPTQDLNDARQKLKDLLNRKLKVPTNSMDAAVARPISNSVVSTEILGIGTPRGIATEDFGIGERFVNSGRTTGVTKGRINLIDVDIFILYPTGTALFVDQVMGLTHLPQFEN
jgi:hypothetical protein